MSTYVLEAQVRTRRRVWLFWWSLGGTVVFPETSSAKNTERTPLLQEAVGTLAKGQTSCRDQLQNLPDISVAQDL